MTLPEFFVAEQEGTLPSREDLPRERLRPHHIHTGIPFYRNGPFDRAVCREVITFHGYGTLPWSRPGVDGVAAQSWQAFGWALLGGEDSPQSR
jgi:hypothetical protein